jgi:anti-anti-sigma factor
MSASFVIPEDGPVLCPWCAGPVDVVGARFSSETPCRRCGHKLWLLWQRGDETNLLRFTGTTVTVEMMDEVKQFARDHTGRHLVLDGPDVRYCSSVVLAKLVNLRLIASQHGKSFRLRRVHAELRRILDLIRLDRVLEMDA